MAVTASLLPYGHIVYLTGAKHNMQSTPLNHPHHPAISAGKPINDHIRQRLTTTQPAVIIVTI